MNIKKPTSYEEQVKLMKNKGFVINDDSNCIEFLRQVNFYRLKAYFLPFRLYQGKYQCGITFQHIQNIYRFDSEIRSILCKTIEKIECFIRSQLAYFISNNHGALCYLDSDLFSQKHNHTLFCDKIEQCIKDHSQSAVVKHHNKKYNGLFPLWVIIEFFSMGMLSYFYCDLKSADKKMIARESFKTVPVCLESWLRCLTDLRNRCAHYSRLYYWTFSSIPQFPNKHSYVADRKLFSQILMLKYLYPDKKEWDIRIVNDLQTIIEQYGNYISLQHIGFPDNWKTLLYNFQPL